MSRYLIERIEATPNIELHPRTQLTRLEGNDVDGLTGVVWRDDRTGLEETRPINHVFLFVGADPETTWLRSCGMAFDAHGFVLTGQAPPDGTGKRVPAALESNISGVFAVGDVRSGSVKRVGGAIGEGANAVALVHQYLALSA